MTKQFDEQAFVTREDNIFNFKLTYRQYLLLVNGLFPIEDGAVFELVKELMVIGEPQKEAFLARYETEKAAFDTAQKADVETTSAAA